MIAPFRKTPRVAGKDKERPRNLNRNALVFTSLASKNVRPKARHAVEIREGLPNVPVPPSVFPQRKIAKFSLFKSSPGRGGRGRA